MLIDYRRLGSSDIKVSSIGLGSWVFGGKHWGGTQQADSMEVIHAAIDMGCNLIDTAPIYGFGRSEEILGEALKGRRDKVILASKCGLIRQGRAIEHCLKSASIKREIEASLLRLKTDYIDIYQCHWPDSSTPIAVTMAALTKLKTQGKIRHIGISNFPLPLIQEARQAAPVDSLQSSFSLLNRELSDKVLPYCQLHKISVLAYGPLGGGILTGKYKQKPCFGNNDARHFFYKYYEENFESVQQFLSVLENLNRPLNQCAINWVRQQKGITSVLVGCRNVQQLKDNMHAAQWKFTDDQMRFISSQVPVVS